MSLLSIQEGDLKGGPGKVLPPRTYRATIESAEVAARGNGHSLNLVLGNIRTKEGEAEFEYQGAQYRIGNRKVFAHHWVSHTNEKAVEVGQSFIKKLLISTGVIAAPKNGETVQDAYETWEALAQDIVGREVIMLTKQRTRTNQAGKQVTEADVSSYLQP